MWEVRSITETLVLTFVFFTKRYVSDVNFAGPTT